MYEVIEPELFKLHATPKLLPSAHHAPSISLSVIRFLATCRDGWRNE